MNICEIMQTTSMDGLTLSEMRAKVRMNIALKAFGKWQKKIVPPVVEVIEEPKQPDLKSDFFNLFT